MTTPVVDKERKRTIEARIQRLRERLKFSPWVKSAEGRDLAGVLQGILDLLEDWL